MSYGSLAANGGGIWAERVDAQRADEAWRRTVRAGARTRYDAYRALLNEWLSELPEADQAEMLARFCTSADLQDEAILAELTLHAAIKQQGYAIEVPQP